MKIFQRISTLAIILTLTYGCNESSTGPDETETGLTDDEQMSIVATEVAADNGGLMADIETAAQAADGEYSMQAAKSAAYDTTISNSWLTFKLNLDFYTKNGLSQTQYVPNVTDRVIYQSSLTGSNQANGDLNTISLNNVSALTITDITSGTAKFNGTSNNNSSYAYGTTRQSVAFTAQSEFTAEDVNVPLNSANYLPTSGKIVGTAKGKYTRSGVVSQKDVDYSFTFEIIFDGDNIVTVTLPSGAVYELNLSTGDITEK